MTIKVGDKMPAGVFTYPGADGPQKMTTDQLFAGKTVVVFSISKGPSSTSWVTKDQLSLARRSRRWIGPSS